MVFIIELDEWTGSAWMHRTTEPLSQDNALYWIKYLAHQDAVQVRNVAMRQCEQQLSP